jgi:nitroimidazol reductase NimA-like FMN-containing flavoprotein (pyridoxamine 5'-phosphate oxidase superfamily)
VHELAADEIDEFLRGQVIGRIGMHANGETYVVPIIYAWDGDCIYVQSIEGRKISMMRDNPTVCFEIDEYDNGSWRSVIVDGTYEELHGDDAKHALALLVGRFANRTGNRRRVSAESVTPVAFRIRPTRMTGRRVQR